MGRVGVPKAGESISDMYAPLLNLAPEFGAAVSWHVSQTSTPPGELLVAASYAEVSAEIGRWLVHDIRGPLQGVTLTLALLSEPDAPPLDEALRDALAGASAEFGGIVDLTDRLLRIPRLDAEPGPLALGDVMREAERFLARRRARHSIVWPADESLARLPPVAMAADQLLHVLLATLIAATRAAGTAGPGSLTLTTARDGNHVRLVLAASPPSGMPPTPLPDDDVRLAASRLLLERAGGALSTSVTAGSASITAHLPAWTRSGG